MFNHIDESQRGAQPYLSHYDQVIAIHIMIKQQDGIQKPVFAGMEDTAKAFDSILYKDVSHALWNKSKIKGNIYLLIANAYSTATTFMKICLAGIAIYGDKLKMCNGVFQGNSQSAPLCVIVTDLVIKQFNHKIENLGKITSILPKTNKLKKYFRDSKIYELIMKIIIIILIVFVDDASLFANELESVKQMLEQYIQDSKEHNLNINNDKTQLIIFNKKHLTTKDKSGSKIIIIKLK